MKSKLDLFKTYCDYFASDDFFIVEHEKYLGSHIMSDNELKKLSDKYSGESLECLTSHERELKDYLENVVFAKRRIEDNMTLINSFRGI